MEYREMSQHISVNKQKIEELKKQSLKTMHKRGARGYVVLDGSSTKGTTAVPDDETLQYREAQTATLFFHDTEERKFKRGEPIALNENDIVKLENKMRNREIRSAVRKQKAESKLNKNQKLIDLKSKRQLEVYNKRSREWRIYNRNSSKMLHRDNSKNLHSAIDNFREKGEERELAEKLAPPVERYGENRLWEMNLRRKDQVESRMFKHKKGHIIENNCYLAIDDPGKEVTVVRRPHSSYTNYKARECDNAAKAQLNKINNLHFKIGDKIHIKANKNSNQKDDNCLIHITEPEKIIIGEHKNIDSLIVEGESKLKSEIEAIKRNKNQHKVLYKDLAQLETQFVDTVDEEIIAINYDKKLYL